MKQKNLGVPDSTWVENKKMFTSVRNQGKKSGKGGQAGKGHGNHGQEARLSLGHARKPQNSLEGKSSVA